MAFSNGFQREADDSLSVTTNAAGSSFRGGFLRDPDGKLVVTTDVTSAIMWGGFLRKVTGELVVTTTPASPVMRGGFWRDGVTGALAVASSAPVAGRKRGFTVDANGYPVVTGLGFAPGSIAGLYLWFDASAITGKVDNDPISQWNDLSGNNLHLVQATGGNQPLYKTNVLNGEPGVLFDGTDDRLDIAVIAAAVSRTIFIVAKQTANTGNATVLSIASLASLNNTTAAWGWSTNGASAAVSLGGTTTNASLITLKVNSAASFDGYVNSGAATNLDPHDTVTTGTTLRIGGRTDGLRPWNGHVFEIIAYDTALSDTDRGSVRAYLLDKYAL